MKKIGIFLVLTFLFFSCNDIKNKKIITKKEKGNYCVLNNKKIDIENEKLIRLLLKVRQKYKRGKMSIRYFKNFWQYAEKNLFHALIVFYKKNPESLVSDLHLPLKEIDKTPLLVIFLTYKKCESPKEAKTKGLKIAMSCDRYKRILVNAETYKILN